MPPKNSSSCPTKFQPLALGTVLPSGWLRDQLQTQADGLSGHLDEFWPDVADSRWIGGQAEGWERGPYWLDGIVPLAVLLDDAKLKAKAARWIEAILAGQQSDGWLGPENRPSEGDRETRRDPWPLFIVLKALIQWEEATGDPRIIPALLRTAHAIDTLLTEEPLSSWAAMRWPDLVLSLHRLHDHTGEPWLIDLVAKAQAQGYDWASHFSEFTLTDKSTEWTLENHVVNHAMALKFPALLARESLDTQAALETAEAAIAVLDRHHGQATGVFSGDESLAGLSPTQGTELCAVVEYLFSLEALIAAFGHAPFGDRWERIAFNALPGTFTTDMWAHQYDQQANQVLCSNAPRPWTNNGSDANVFGLEPHFGCCTANMHQGWPKFASHLWMAAPGDGLAAVAYAPCVVKATVGDGVEVTITEETDYPFRDTVRFAVGADSPVRFPIHLRIPVWATEATVRVGDGEAQPVVPGTFHVLEREWLPGETVTLHLPMTVRLEPRPNGAVCVLRGPLVFSLKIGEEFRHFRGEAPHDDWEVFPMTPWNYGLALPTVSPEAVFTVTEGPLSPRPFAPEIPPVTLTAPARRLPQWGLAENCAGPLPVSPAPTDAPVEQVTLIPYSSAHLRITEFPTVAPE